MNKWNKQKRGFILKNKKKEKRREEKKRKEKKRKEERKENHSLGHSNIKNLDKREET